MLTLIGAWERVSPTEARACNPPHIYFSCKCGCGIPFAIKTAFSAFLFSPLPSSPPPSILSFLFPPLCLVSTFEVHDFPAAAEQRRLRNSHPLLGAHTRTAWWLPISVNTSPRSNTLGRAGGMSGDEASNWRLYAAGLRLKRWLWDLLLSKAIKSLCSSKLINRSGTQQDCLASKDPTVWLSYQSHAEEMQQARDVCPFFTQAAINQSID